MGIKKALIFKGEGSFPLRDTLFELTLKRQSKPHELFGILENPPHNFYYVEQNGVLKMPNKAYSRDLYFFRNRTGAKFKKIKKTYKEDFGCGNRESFDV